MLRNHGRLAFRRTGGARLLTLISLHEAYHLTLLLVTLPWNHDMELTLKPKQYYGDLAIRIPRGYEDVQASSVASCPVFRICPLDRFGPIMACLDCNTMLPARAQELPSNGKSQAFSGFPRLSTGKKTVKKRKLGNTAQAANLVVAAANKDQNVPSAPTIWHQALKDYLEKLSDHDREFLLSVKSNAALDVKGVESLIQPIQTTYEKTAYSRLLEDTGSLLSHLESFGRAVDAGVASIQIAGVIWGGIRLILEASNTLSLFHSSASLNSNVGTDCDARH